MYDFPSFEEPRRQHHRHPRHHRSVPRRAEEDRSAGRRNLERGPQGPPGGVRDLHPDGLRDACHAAASQGPAPAPDPVAAPTAPDPGPAAPDPGDVTPPPDDPVVG